MNSELHVHYFSSMFMFITLERHRLIKKEVNSQLVLRGRGRVSRTGRRAPRASRPPVRAPGARPGARGPGGGGRPLVQSKLHGKL